MKSTEQISRTLLLNTTLLIFCQFMSSFPSPLCEQSLRAQATKPIPNKKSNIMQHMYTQRTNNLWKIVWRKNAVRPFHSNRCPLASLECLPSLQGIQLLLSVAKGPAVFRRHLDTLDTFQLYNGTSKLGFFFLLMLFQSKISGGRWVPEFRNVCASWKSQKNGGNNFPNLEPCYWIWQNNHKRSSWDELVSPNVWFLWQALKDEDGNEKAWQDGPPKAGLPNGPKETSIGRRFGSSQTWPGTIHQAFHLDKCDYDTKSRAKKKSKCYPSHSAALGIASVLDPGRIGQSFSKFYQMIVFALPLLQIVFDLHDWL